MGNKVRYKVFFQLAFLVFIRNAKTRNKKIYAPDFSGRLTDKGLLVP